MGGSVQVITRTRKFREVKVAKGDPLQPKCILNHSSKHSVAVHFRNKLRSSDVQVAMQVAVS